MNCILMLAGLIVPIFYVVRNYSPWPWSKDKGRIRHYKSIDDAEGRVLVLPETLTLTRAEDNSQVRVHCEKADNTFIPGSDDDRVIGGSTSTLPVDPLKV